MSIRTTCGGVMVAAAMRGASSASIGTGAVGFAISNASCAACTHARARDGPRARAVYLPELTINGRPRLVCDFDDGGLVALVAPATT